MKKMMARLYSLLAIASLAFLLPPLAAAESASGYLLMPLAGSNYKCATQGGASYQRLLEALKTAQSTAGTMLPAGVWTLLTPPQPDQTAELSAADAAACEALIGFYSKPDFKENFRQMIVTLMAGSYVSDCIIDQPATESQISAAFIAANQRNGLPVPDVKALAESIRAKRKQASNNRPVSLESCNEVAGFLASSDFDNMFSEAAIQKLFSGL